MSESVMGSKLVEAIGVVNGYIWKHFKAIEDGGKPDCPWDSLVINRRKPYTYRAFVLPNDGPLKGCRICLHRFEPCSAKEAFLHPHPWPSAMYVVEGQYRMRVGCSDGLTSEPTMVMETTLSAGSSYVMEEPRGWHSVQPLTTCWSIMVNGGPWGERAHAEAPTTKGKDLDRMSRDELNAHLRAFQTKLAIRMDVLDRIEGTMTKVKRACEE